MTWDNASNRDSLVDETAEKQMENDASNAKKQKLLNISSSQSFTYKLLMPYWPIAEKSEYIRIKVPQLKMLTT